MEIVNIVEKIPPIKARCIKPDYQKLIMTTPFLLESDLLPLSTDKFFNYREVVLRNGEIISSSEPIPFLREEDI